MLKKRLRVFKGLSQDVVVHYSMALKCLKILFVLQNSFLPSRNKTLQPVLMSQYLSVCPGTPFFILSYNKSKFIFSIVSSLAACNTSRLLPADSTSTTRAVTHLFWVNRPFTVPNRLSFTVKAPAG